MSSDYLPGKILDDSDGRLLNINTFLLHLFKVLVL